MSELDRALRLTRAYANRARESIFPGESPEARAVKELNEALETGVTLKKQEVEEFKQYVETMTIEEARIVLGISTDASFATVKSQHKMLVEHLKQFEIKYPEKTSVSKREKDRIEKAFVLLSSNVDSSEKRFGSLEIE